MTLKEMQGILYDILCSVDDACKAENVTYTLAGGTAIGAVRHQGFIPWDDDIDICIWRKDLPAFLSAMEKHLPAHLKVTIPHDLLPNFFDFVIRVQDTRYHWHESTAEDDFYGNLQNHPAVDIFTLVPSGNTSLAHAWATLRYKMVYALSRGHRYKGKKEPFSVSQAVFSVVAAIGSLIPMKTLLKNYENMCNKAITRNTKYCAKPDNTPSYISLLLECDWYRETVEKPYEDRLLPLPVEYDKLLTRTYGDYMTPPKDRSVFIQHFKEESPQDSDTQD